MWTRTGDSKCLDVFLRERLFIISNIQSAAKTKKNNTFSSMWGKIRANSARSRLLLVGNDKKITRRLNVCRSLEDMESEHFNDEFNRIVKVFAESQRSFLPDCSGA